MIAAPLQITDQDARSISSVKNSPDVGQFAVTSDGRGYRYTLAGGTALEAGKLYTSADVAANFTDKTVAATTAVGATSVLVNVAGTITANAYAGGYFVVNDATGEGNAYLITGNGGRTGSGTITVYLQDPLTVGLTVSVSEFTLVPHPYAGVIISINQADEMAVGVPNVAVTANYYCWLQTGGICSVLADEAIAKGAALTVGTSVGGAVEMLDAAGEQQIGYAAMAMVDTEYQPGYFTIW